MKGVVSMDIFNNAKFIWCKGYENTVNCYVDFFESLAAKKDAEYRLYITADSNYTVYINDKYVNCGQFADYPDICKIYDDLDITEYLCEGDNEIEIIGYCQNEDSSTYRKGTPGVMYVITENGVPVVNSDLDTTVYFDHHYKSGPVDKVSGQLSYSFECDLSNKKAVLSETVETRKFEKLAPRPIKKLVMKDAPKIRLMANGSFVDGEKTGRMGDKMQFAYMGFGERYENIDYEKGLELVRNPEKDGVYAVFDIGREESGFITFDIEVPEDSEIMLGWGEHLDDVRIRTVVGGRNFAARVVVPAGRTKFSHYFKRCGGRYVSIHSYSPSVKIHYVGIIPTDYPTTSDVSFKCADHMHNEIYETCKRTLLLCMHEHYEDCPWREQALYAMDSRNQMLCGYYTFKEYDFAKASLRLIGQSIRDDDLLELCSPAKVSITIPCFCAIFSLQLWEYLLHTGDIDFAKEMLPIAERVCEKFRSLTDTNGLIPILKDYEYWNFYEWQPGLEGSIGKVDAEDEITYDLPLQAFVSLAYESLGKINSVLGNENKSSYWTENSESLKCAAHKEFYNYENKYYYTKIVKNSGERFHLSQLAQALAVYSGICPETATDGVLDSMVSNKDFIKVTLSNSIYYYEALMKRPEKYGRFVFDDIAKVYGSMLKNNATTFWETVVGGDDFGFAGSLCHGWSAIPSYIYFRYCLGIYPDGLADIKKHDAVSSQITGLYEAESDYFDK